MAESKHTTGAEKAAKTITQEVLILNRNDLLRFLDDADVPGGLTDTIAAIIDQETSLPELQARIDQFEVEISDLNESWETEFKLLEAENEKLKADIRSTLQPGGRE